MDTIKDIMNSKTVDSELFGNFYIKNDDFKLIGLCDLQCEGISLKIPQNISREQILRSFILSLRPWQL